MSKLDKYFDSRAKDKRFKLLHEESDYLKLLKDEAKIKIADEEPKAEQEKGSSEDGQTLLNESENLTEDEEFSAEKIMEAWLEDTFNPDEIKEISIAVARKASDATEKKAYTLKKRKLTPGRTGKTARQVRMGRV